MKGSAAWLTRVKMIAATNEYPQYKGYAGKLRMQAPSQWFKLSKDQLMKDLRVIFSNSASLRVSHTHANMVTQTEHKRSKSRNPGKPSAHMRVGASGRVASAV